jgi:hypothetical protein
MLKEDVDEYLHASRSVEGWLFPVDAYLIGYVDEIQKAIGLRGNLFEIGVHHGKSAALLGRMASDGEVLGVCDVFDDQDQNVSRSGEGSRQLFERNVERLSDLPTARLHVFAKRSALLTTQETTSECRLFHIDGGHRPADVVADLGTAAQAIVAAGVVVLDDVFNPSWPGVAEGLYRFIQGDAGTFLPFLIGGNKVFLAPPASVPIYLKHLSSAEAWHRAVGTAAFVAETKEWLGTRVWVAGRTAWVDIDPIEAARRHLGNIGWWERLRLLWHR